MYLYEINIRSIVLYVFINLRDFKNEFLTKQNNYNI